MDPIVWFLSEDGHRGHCEYFAAAMTLMCQSLGIQARVATGYRCDEYNDFSRRFVVRQSQAHAWVEVLTPEGWRTFDPTSGRDANGGRTDSSMWQKMKHLFDWLEQVPRSRFGWGYRRDAYRRMAERLGPSALEAYGRVFARETSEAAPPHPAG